jgi:hypothetical protein
MTALTAAPVRVVELRTSPITRLSVHQHVHHPSHTRLLVSRSSSTLSFHTTHVAAPQPGVAERIVVKRLQEARPLDPTHRALSPAHPAPPTTMPRPASSRSGALPVAARATDNDRQPPMGRSRRHRVRIVETERRSTTRTRHDTTHSARTMQVRETRWRQGLDAVRLEWRKTAPLHQAHATTAMGSNPSPASPARTPVAIGSSTPAATTHAPRPDRTSPVLTMDRSTLDRLADNVMQRIERRVRIERERRGL